MLKQVQVAGADLGFLLGGGAPLSNDVTDRLGKQNFESEDGFISGGRGCPSYTLPLDPPLIWLWITNGCQICSV